MHFFLCSVILTVPIGSGNGRKYPICKQVVVNTIILYYLSNKEGGGVLSCMEEWARWVQVLKEGRGVYNGGV